MLQDIIAVEPLEGHKLRLRFEDGAEGEVSLHECVPFQGVFTPLLEPAFFNQVFVNPDTGTVQWPNGADLDPDVLYARITGSALPLMQSTPSVA